jgi:hypothetical protein
MTNNIVAKSFTHISTVSHNSESTSETYRYIKNILGINTDLPITDIIEMLNQVYIVN